MDIMSLLIIFAVGVIAGSFGTLTGGGSLITIPALIFLGLPPHSAIGTNRLGVTGVHIGGWYKFNQKRMVNYAFGFMIGIPALFGSMLGVNLVLQMNEMILKRLVATLMIFILVFITVKPKIGLEKTKFMVKNHVYIIGAVVSFFLGIYGGFYGAGAGTFFSYILILLFGQTFLESAATRKIAGFLITTMAAILFGLAGVIDYSLGIALFIGTSTGSFIGAHYSDKIGEVWIKRLFFAIVLTMSIKLMT
ncbi:MAG: TSUP family transporter [Proteobacteria bacterium]|nr:TSUP family transporter [Pseudomonadota bacterium]